MKNTVDMENALLAAFLYLDDLFFCKDDVFNINENIFTSSYRRAVAAKINDESKNEKMYGFLSMAIEEKTAGTKFEQEWCDIISQNPMGLNVAKRIQLKLEDEYKKRAAKAFR